MRELRLGSPVIAPAAIAAGTLAFAAFVAALGHDPLEVLSTMAEGAFGSAFAWQNTLVRAAPLVLTALAVALPARAGLVMIGGEGLLALGALAAAVVGRLAGEALAGPGAVSWPAIALAALAGCAVGAAGAALTALLRMRRGVNETIASLLVGYIAIAVFNHLVEGPLRDPASLNKPSTRPVGDAATLGVLSGTDVHLGLALAAVLALIAQVVMSASTAGFALRVVGGNPRAAQLAGLPVTALTLAAAAAGGACAGLSGAVEVLAVHGAANASVLAGYGYGGILVAFIARHQPAAVLPVALLVGGIGAAGSLLQRRLGLPDATTQVLQGLLFVAILLGESWRGHVLRPADPPADAGPGERPASAPVAAAAPSTSRASHASGTPR